MSELKAIACHNCKAINTAVKWHYVPGETGDTGRVLCDVCMVDYMNASKHQAEVNPEYTNLCVICDKPAISGTRLCSKCSNNYEDVVIIGDTWKVPFKAEDEKSAGIKFDQDKDPWQLLDWEALSGTVAVLKHGAKKYAPRNWEKGLNWSKCFRAAVGHLVSWWLGEDIDKDSGLPHLDCAACEVMFLQAHFRRKLGKDDRPSLPLKETKNA